MAGEPSYIELGVPDLAAARAFYGGLLGWEIPGDDRQGGQVDTPTLSIGVHGGDPDTHFEVFFTVDDLDASITRLATLGGEVLGDVHDSGDFGRWVECRDDQGVRFGLRETGSAR